MVRIRAYRRFSSRTSSSSYGGNGQVRPARRVRLRYLLTVPWARPRLRATARCDMRCSAGAQLRECGAWTVSRSASRSSAVRQKIKLPVLQTVSSARLLVAPDRDRRSRCSGNGMDRPCSRPTSEDAWWGPIAEGTEPCRVNPAPQSSPLEQPLPDTFLGHALHEPIPLPYQDE